MNLPEDSRVSRCATTYSHAYNCPAVDSLMWSSEGSALTNAQPALIGAPDSSTGFKAIVCDGGTNTVFGEIFLHGADLLITFWFSFVGADPSADAVVFDIANPNSENLRLQFI